MDKRQKFENQIIDKAMKDAGFRQRLLENPKAVIQEETGIEFPAKVKVKVLEEEAMKIYLVIPSAQDQFYETELTDHDLEQIAGGLAQNTGILCTFYACPPPGDPGG